jgi:hypothetical protein
LLTATDDAIAITLHTALSHLDKRNTYVRMVSIDYSSAFNTIIPSKLIIKLEALGLNPALKGHPQAVKVGNITSTPLILNIGAPQGCVLIPLLYSLFTHDCVMTVLIRSGYRRPQPTKSLQDTILVVNTHATFLNKTILSVGKRAEVMNHDYAQVQLV